MEIDPDNDQVKIVHLAKYTKKAPVFTNIYTDLGKTVAAPNAYSQIEMDLGAAGHGVLNLRWFKGGTSDPKLQGACEGRTGSSQRIFPRQPHDKHKKVMSSHYTMNCKNC